MKTLLKRFFAPEAFKGQENYIDTQKKYEIIKTVLFFALSGAVFALGYITTGSRMNLLTIVAVLGCLPASKSAVNMIMFLRFKSFDRDKAERFKENAGDLPCLYDCVFTTYDKSYQVGHLVYRQNNLIGFTGSQCDLNRLEAHLKEKLEIGGHKGLTIKIFDNEDKYIERLLKLKELAADNDPEPVFNTLKAISL